MRVLEGEMMNRTERQMVLRLKNQCGSAAACVCFGFLCSFFASAADMFSLLFLTEYASVSILKI